MKAIEFKIAFRLHDILVLDIFRYALQAVLSPKDTAYETFDFIGTQQICIVGHTFITRFEFQLLVGIGFLRTYRTYQRSAFCVKRCVS